MRNPLFSETDVVEIAELRRHFKKLSMELEKSKEKIRDLELLIDKMQEALRNSRDGASYYE